MRAFVRSNNKSGEVSLDVMRDGDIAEVVRWRDNPHMEHTAVMRYGDKLIPIGCQRGLSYASIFTGRNPEIKIRILHSGSNLKLKNTER